VVRIRAGKPFPFAVPLSTFRTDAILAATDLVRLPRLSVIPMTATQEKRLVERSGLEAK
jgi:predicted RNA-binding protein with PUA-like domain